MCVLCANIGYCSTAGSGRPKDDPFTTEHIDRVFLNQRSPGKYEQNKRTIGLLSEIYKLREEKAAVQKGERDAKTQMEEQAKKLMTLKKHELLLTYITEEAAPAFASQIAREETQKAQANVKTDLTDALRKYHTMLSAPNVMATLRNDLMVELGKIDLDDKTGDFKNFILAQFKIGFEKAIAHLRVTKLRLYMLASNVADVYEKQWKTNEETIPESIKQAIINRMDASVIELYDAISEEIKGKDSDDNSTLADKFISDKVDQILQRMNEISLL